MTFGEKVIQFNRSLSLKARLPKNIRVMNPFAESETALNISSAFYRKYYKDTNKRKLILGINPGRLGAGVTGVPFTDTKRLKGKCQLEFEGKQTHEPSSVFVYEVIDAYGGVDAFYKQVYISSVSPLGFVIQDEKGKEKNYNYYDSKALTEAVKPFIIQSIQQQIAFGIHTDACYCLGSGKNFKFLNDLNKEQQFFGEVIPLEHPRFVMQYKSKTKEEYIEKYLRLLG